MLICIKKKLSNSEAQFMKNLSNTEAGLKKKTFIKKRVLLAKSYITDFDTILNTHLIHKDLIVLC